MALPTRAKQIAAVAALLEKAADADPPLSLADLAEVVVDGYLDMITPAKPALHPHVGMAFKHATSSSVQHVAHNFTSVRGHEVVWCVSGASRFGFLVPVESTYWDNAETSTAKSGAPGNNPDWQPGDKVSRSQRAQKFEVVATGDKCVLLMDWDGVPQPESNDNMKNYYKREVQF